LQAKKAEKENWGSVGLENESILNNLASTLIDHRSFYDYLTHSYKLLQIADKLMRSDDTSPTANVLQLFL
jgi:hypothetical protein